jgi:hypothetical protein
MTTTCRHWWFIEPVDSRRGDVAWGVCKLCGAKRKDFVKSWTDRAFNRAKGGKPA